MSEVDIKNVRQEIDDIDEQVKNLLRRRLLLARTIGQYKKELGLPMRELLREHEVIKSYGELGAFRGIGEIIIRDCCKAQTTRVDSVYE